MAAVRYANAAQDYGEAVIAMLVYHQQPETATAMIDIAEMCWRKAREQLAKVNADRRATVDP